MDKKYFIVTNTSKRMSLKFPDKRTLPVVDVDRKLSMNSSTIATIVILGGCVHGNIHMRKEIISKIGRIPPQWLFIEHLVEVIVKDIKRNIHLVISDEYIFDKIVPFYSQKYDLLPDRFSVRGHLANTAQALAINPTLSQVQKSVVIFRNYIKWAEKEGYAQKAGKLRKKE